MLEAPARHSLPRDVLLNVRWKMLINTLTWTSASRRHAPTLCSPSSKITSLAHPKHFFLRSILFFTPAKRPLWFKSIQLSMERLIKSGEGRECWDRYLGHSDCQGAVYHCPTTNGIFYIELGGVGWLNKTRSQSYKGLWRVYIEWCPL
jgi:hypothetical protein